MRLLLTMGYHIPETGGAWLYDTAALVEVDWRAKRVVREFTYRSPPERAAMSGHMLFAYGHLDGPRLLVTTHTEVVDFDLDGWRIDRVVSLPHFNDLHHVIPSGDGGLYVCNTGLQAVQKLSAAGELLETHPTDGVPTWDAYDPRADYRPLSTKPHPVHPNHLFWVGDKLWVTRCKKLDAVQLDDHSRRFEMGVGQPHDGVEHGGLYYFTTTNGHVLAFDPATGERVRQIDLNAVDGRNQQLGWCRGLRFLDDDLALVGFGQFRRTRHREFAHWILNDGKAALPTRLALYDLKGPRLLEEMPFTGKREGSAMYSIFTLPG